MTSKKSTLSHLYPETRNKEQALCFIAFFITANLIILALSAFVAHSSEYTSSRTVDKEIFLKQENNYHRFAVLELQSLGTSTSCPEGWEPWLKNVTTQPTQSFCVCQNGQTGYSLSESVSQKSVSKNNISSLTSDAGSGETSLNGTTAESKTETQSSSEDVNLNKQCKHNCFKLPAVLPVMLPRVSSGLICARPLRMHYDDFTLSENGICPKGQRVCGKDSRDFICLQNEIPCPLNKFVIYPKLTSIQDKAALDAQFSNRKYFTLSLSDTQDLHFSNLFPENKIVTTDLQLSHGQPCLDPRESPLSQSEQLWLPGFWKSPKTEQCGKKLDSGIEFDSRWSPVFSISKHAFLVQNKFFDLLFEKSQNLEATDSIQENSAKSENDTSIQQARDYFAKSLDADTSIYHRSFVNFRAHCRTQNSSSLQTLHYLHKRDTFEYQIIKKRIIGAGTISALMAVLLFSLFIVLKVKKTHLWKHKHKKMKRIAASIIFAISSGTVVFPAILLPYIWKRYSTLKWFCNNDCGDQILKITFCSGSSFLWLVVILFVVLLLIILIMVAVYLFYIISWSSKHKLRQIPRITKQKLKGVTSIDDIARVNKQVGSSRFQKSTFVETINISQFNTEPGLHTGAHSQDESDVGGSDHFRYPLESELNMDTINSIPLTMQRIDEAESFEEFGSSKRKNRPRLIPNALISNIAFKQTKDFSKEGLERYREGNVEVVRMVSDSSEANKLNRSPEFVISSERGLTVTEEYSAFLDQSSRMVTGANPHSLHKLGDFSLRPQSFENTPALIPYSNKIKKQSSRKGKILSTHLNSKKSFQQSVLTQEMIRRPVRRREIYTLKNDEQPVFEDGFEHSVETNPLRFSNNEHQEKRYQAAGKIGNTESDIWEKENLVLKPVRTREMLIPVGKFGKKKNTDNDNKIKRDLRNEESRVSEDDLRGISVEAGDYINRSTFKPSPPLNQQTLDQNSTKPKSILKKRINPSKSSTSSRNLPALRSKSQHKSVSNSQKSSHPILIGSVITRDNLSKRSISQNSKNVKRRSTQNTKHGKYKYNHNPKSENLTPIERVRRANMDSFEHSVTSNPHKISTSRSPRPEHYKMRNKAKYPYQDDFNHNVVTDDDLSKRGRSQNSRIPKPKRGSIQTASMDDFYHCVLSNKGFGKESNRHVEKRIPVKQTPANVYIDDFEHSVVSDRLPVKLTAKQGHPRKSTQQTNKIQQIYKPGAERRSVFIDDFHHSVISGVSNPDTIANKLSQSRRMGKSKSRRQHVTPSQPSECTIDDLVMIETRHTPQYINTSIDPEDARETPQPPSNAIFNLQKETLKRRNRNRTKRPYSRPKVYSMNSFKSLNLKDKKAKRLNDTNPGYSKNISMQHRNMVDSRRSKQAMGFESGQISAVLGDSSGFNTQHSHNRGRFRAGRSLSPYKQCPIRKSQNLPKSRGKTNSQRRRGNFTFKKPKQI